MTSGSIPLGRPVEAGSLIVREGVELYGGFAGSETHRAQLGPTPDTTVIDGSTARGGEAAYRVVVGQGRTVLDGFTVTGGVAMASLYEDSQCGLYAESMDGQGMRVARCRFTGNDSRKGRGVVGVYQKGDVAYTHAEITDCVFEGNHSEFVTVTAMNTPLRNCVFRGNTGGALMLVGSCVAESCLFDGRSGTGAVTCNSATGHVLRDCVFVECTSPLGAAVRYTWAGRETIDRCWFEGNRATAGDGGAIAAMHVPALRVTNSVFVGNEASGRGGAIYAESGSLDPAEGSGWAGYVRVLNCTFYGNRAADGGALFAQEAYMVVQNSILWADAPAPLGWSPVYTADTLYQPMRVDYSLVKGGFSAAGGRITGKGNIDADPRFVSPETGDFRLQAGSPAIDTGSGTGAPGIDYEGRVRPIGAGYDMGAYEAPVPEDEAAPGDVDRDGHVDAADVQLTVNAALGLGATYADCDIDRDGQVDAADVQLVINAVLGV